MQNTVKKIGGGGLWHILKAAEVLPTTGKYSLAVKVLQS
jgi:hypothetical protein